MISLVIITSHCRDDANKTMCTHTLVSSRELAPNHLGSAYVASALKLRFNARTHAYRAQRGIDFLMMHSSALEGALENLMETDDET